MTTTFDTDNQTTTNVIHPLEPLTAEEIRAAVAILRRVQSLSNSVRFATVVLSEPSKSIVLNFKPGQAIQREAFIVVLDNATAQTYEAIVSLTQKAVVSWKHIPGVQPSIMLDEFVECEAVVKANPEFQTAIRKRGITDPGLVMVDPWSAGHYGEEDETAGTAYVTRPLLGSFQSQRQWPMPAQLKDWWSWLT